MNARKSLSRPHLLAARLVALTAIFACASPLHAQIASQPVPPPVQPVAKKLSAEELGRLLAPIALYPDALIALILPASTVPSDVVLGARYLKSGGDPGQIDNQPWDESVKALARYPDVLAWMDENLEWTSSVGEAFVEQPADVMNAVQALRAQAKAAGNLVDTPQQKVVDEDSSIRIVPTDPEIIYVPQYDPQIVYVYTSVLTFGPGFFVGPWLCYDFDWNRRCFYRGNWRGWNHDWHNQWNHGPNGNRVGANVVNIDTTNANPWQPSVGALRQISQRQVNNNGNARYVNARSATVSTQPPVTQGNPTVRTAQPGIYNPALRTALPQPSNLGRSPIGNGRNQASVRNGNPAINPLVNPTPVPSNVRSIPETSPARPTRTLPSTAPQVPGQLNSPVLPRSGTNEPRPSRQPDRWVPETPPAARTLQPTSPTTGPSIQPARSEPTRNNPQNPATRVPATIQPTQTAPVIQQRPQVQEQPSQPRAQVPQPDRSQQRQSRPETASAPSQQQRPASAVQPQAQGQPSPVPSKKKLEEKKAE